MNKFLFNTLVSASIFFSAASLSILFIGFLNTPVFATSCFFFSFAILFLSTFTLKEKQIDYLIDRIGEKYIMELDIIFADDGKTEDEKIALADVLTDGNPIAKTFNSIFGVNEEFEINIVADAILNDMLCFDIKKYVDNHEKFEYYYHSKYLK